MAHYCENCGCKVFNGRCTNCHEELYILDQYLEQDMELPAPDSDFMKKVVAQENEVSENQGNGRDRYYDEFPDAYQQGL